MTIVSGYSPSDKICEAKIKKGHLGKGSP